MKDEVVHRLLSILAALANRTRCQDVLSTTYSTSRQVWKCYLTFIELHAVDKLHAKKKMPGMIQIQRDDVSSL